jgi:hypothetical protein
MEFLKITLPPNVCLEMMQPVSCDGFVAHLIRTTGAIAFATLGLRALELVTNYTIASLGERKLYPARDMLNYPDFAEMPLDGTEEQMGEYLRTKLDTNLWKVVDKEERAHMSRVRETLHGPPEQAKATIREMTRLFRQWRDEGVLPKIGAICNRFKNQFSGRRKTPTDSIYVHTPWTLTVWRYLQPQKPDAHRTDL